ncbi:MAG: TetR/AcrR family transcriptional regulator [Erysipelotrichaceae bacterium]|nr:TetR/AcrR family transcriptional regulator [Erysipelotrichaceae bacterium]
MSKKELIQETALKLFNEKGYNNVSLREIAKEANTTIGNLTYHFPQKEDLLIHIVDELHNNFIEYKDGLHKEELLVHLLNTFVTAEKNEVENSFYYKNIHLISLDSKNLANKNMLFQKDLFDYYVKIFSTLRDEEVLHNLNDQSIQSIVYIIITICAAWLQDNIPYSNEEIPSIRLSQVLNNLIYPYISDDYVEVYYNFVNKN